MDPNGDLLHGEDIDWWSGYGLPFDTKKGRPLHQHGRMQTIPETPAYTLGAASSGEPEPSGGESPLPAQGSVAQLRSALCNLQKCLRMSNGWDARLCDKEKTDLPEWWDHVGLSTHQFKFNLVPKLCQSWQRMAQVLSPPHLLLLRRRRGQEGTCCCNCTSSAH